LAEHVGVILELARLHEVEARDRERLGMLGRASDLLASTLDHDTVHGELARMAVPWFSEFCVVMLPDGAGLRCITAAHDGTALRFGLPDLGPESVGPTAGLALLATAWRSQRAVLLGQVSVEAGSAPLWDKLCPGRRARSLLVVPMVSLGVTTGLVCFVQASLKRRMEERDIPIAEELAMRCVLAVENARLFREAQDAVTARDIQLGNAQDALAGRDGVLRIVAHDLRSPLAGIRLLGSSLLQQVPEEQRSPKHPMALLSRTVDRMDRLIQDLLDVARLDGGVLPLEHGMCDVGFLLAEAVEANALRASQSSIRIVSELKCSRERLYADRARLLQALDNLIGNALKFTPAGGLIVVGVKDGPERVPDLVFFVRDDGEGIAPEHKERLFERFWKATPNDVRGAGLGLSIVKGIVAAHGGRVCFDSALGEGSTFYFSIPVIEEPVTLSVIPATNAVPELGHRRP
jgi:signal transduction histidine kinase